MLKLLKNSRGLSLTEVVVATGIIGIATMATMSLQKTNLDIQRQNQVVNTAQQMKTKIEGVLRDQRTWDKTMELNPAMACLRNGTSCSAFIGVETRFNLYDDVNATAATSPFITSATADDGSAAGPGFNESGAQCAGYTPAGNNACPFSYYASWQPTCTAPCLNPLIRIRVVLFYRPTPGTPLELNTLKYSFEGPSSFFYRTPKSGGRSFRLTHQSTAAGGVCSTNPAAPTFRPVTVPTAADDPQGVVQGPPVGGVFTLGAGSYKCSVNSVGFAVDGFTVSLIQSPAGTIVGSASGFAPRWVQSSVSFEANFSVPAGTTRSYALSQVCQNLPGGFPSADNLGLGMPVAPYAVPSVFASISCSLLQ